MEYENKNPIWPLPHQVRGKPSLFSTIITIYTYYLCTKNIPEYYMYYRVLFELGQSLDALLLFYAAVVPHEAY